MNSPEVGVLVRNLEALKQALQNEPEYEDFRQTQDRDIVVVREKALQTAREEGSRVNEFLKDYLSKNFAAPQAEELALKQAEVESALEANDVDRLMRLIEDIRATAARLSLAKEMEDFRIPSAKMSPSLAMCLDLAEKKRWQEAFASCKQAVTEEPGNAKAVAALDSATRALREEQERLHVQMQSTDLLHDIDEFEAQGKHFTQPVAIATLRAALLGNQTAQTTALAASIAALEAELEKDPGYAAYRRDREAATAKLKFEAQATAIAEGRRISAFIGAFISSHVTSINVPTLLKKRSAIEDAIASKRTETIVSQNAAAVQEIERAGQKSSLDEFRLEAAENAAKPKFETTSNDLIVNDANRALLVGGLRDVLLLFNATGRASGVRSNLLGQVVFEGRPKLCWYETQPPKELSTRLAFAALAHAGADEPDVMGSCLSRKLDDYDVILLRRGDFLKAERAYAKALVDRFEAETVKSLATITEADIARKEADRAKLVGEIQRDFEAGDRAGFGVIDFGNGSATLCIVVGGDASIHEDLLKELSMPNRGELDQLVSRKMIADAETAYASMRRGDCRAIYASGKQLTQIYIAAKREKLSFHIPPIWIDDDTVRALAQAQQERNAKASQEEEQRRQAQAQREQLEKIARQERDEEKARQQAELQKTHGTIANGYAARIGDWLRDFLQGKDLAEMNQTAIPTLFPELAQWYEHERERGWELVSDGFGTQLLDFGDMQWNDRTIQVVFTRVTVRLKHKDIGDYEAECRVLGAMFDEEFGRTRDTFEMPCGEEETSLKDWQTSRRFESHWLVH